MSMNASRTRCRTHTPEAREICQLCIAHKHFDDSDLTTWRDHLERDWWMCNDEITKRTPAKNAKKVYLDLQTGRRSFRAMAFADRGDACSALSCRHVIARYSAQGDCYVCQLIGTKIKSVFKLKSHQLRPRPCSRDRSKMYVSITATNSTAGNG